jgi:hypothetical protein
LVRVVDGIDVEGGAARGAALCQQLNTSRTSYPGATLTLHYEIKEHQSTA